MGHDASSAADAPRGAADPALLDRVRRARQGDRSALEGLLASYRGHLTALAGVELGPRLKAKVDASDVAQETLLKAHRAFPEFRGTTEGEWVTWLRRVLARTLADQVRRYARTGSRRMSREQSLEGETTRSAAEVGDALVADLTSPSFAASRREGRAALARALEALAPDHRTVIVLRTLEQRDWGDVAERLGRTPDAARMLWARALKELRPLLDAHR